MKTHLKQLIGAGLAVLFVLTMSSSHAADTNSSRYSAKVKVNISAADSIRGAVSSYVNRELRSLTDVEIVENDPEWITYNLAMELKTVDGYKSGVAISTVIVSAVDNQLLSGWFQPEFKDIGLKVTSGLAGYPDQWLSVGSADDLQKLCKDIVADFDTKHLECPVQREMRA
jgi:hypothetical protein